MALEMKRVCEKCGVTLTASGVAYIFAVPNAHIARIARSRCTLSAQIAVASSCHARVETNMLLHRLLRVFDSIGQETFIADDAHVDQPTMHAGRQKLLTEPGQSWRLGPAEHIRGDGQIELIDQAALQQGAKQGRSAFARDGADFVFVA